MEILPDVDVFVGNITYIDFAIYDMWLKHIEADEASNLLMKSSNESAEENSSFYYSYVLDNYRIYGMLESMLHNPLMLSTQMTFQICAESQTKLIKKYYQFDEVVIREILGKKLSKSTRRDLDEIAIKTRKKLKSCQRQFDNCRRVLKQMEDMPGRLVDNIQKHFLLPLELAWDYSAIVFLANQRLDCSRRKLFSLTFINFVECSKILLESWTFGATDPSAPDIDIELDQEFFHELRGVKILISDQKLFDKHRSLTLQKTKADPLKLVNDAQTQWSDGLFRQLSRGIIGIASNLYKTKEMRNYFFDIFEKVIEPCKAFGWDNAMFATFLESYTLATEGLRLQNLRGPLIRYLKTTTKCLLEIYKPDS